MILDEPTADLDPASAALVVEAVERRHGPAVAVLLIAHQPELVPDGSHEGKPTITVHARTAPSVLSRARALIMAGHPGPSLAITALVTLLAAQAAPHGIGPVLTAPGMLAGQLSVGWSNDAMDASRDAAAGRTDKPVATGAISVRAVWIAACAALLAALTMALAISVASAIILAVIVGAAWAYNLGLKSTSASGLMYILGFGPIPAYAASTLPGQPAADVVCDRGGGLGGPRRPLR